MKHLLTSVLSIATTIAVIAVLNRTDFGRKIIAG